MVCTQYDGQVINDDSRLASCRYQGHKKLLKGIAKRQKQEEVWGQPGEEGCTLYTVLYCTVLLLYYSIPYYSLGFISEGARVHTDSTVRHNYAAQCALFSLRRSKETTVLLRRSKETTVRYSTLQFYYYWEDAGGGMGGLGAGPVGGWGGPPRGRLTHGM